MLRAGANPVQRSASLIRTRHRLPAVPLPLAGPCRWPIVAPRMVKAKRESAMSQIHLRHGVFLPPFHPMDENPAACMDRDLELMQWLDRLGFHEAWIGEHHSAGWETISSPELFIAIAAERTRSIRFG